jgi:hypothetical protein
MKNSRKAVFLYAGIGFNAVFNTATKFNVLNNNYLTYNK